jgi:hypothetical protein
VSARSSSSGSRHIAVAEQLGHKHALACVLNSLCLYSSTARRHTRWHPSTLSLLAMVFNTVGSCHHAVPSIWYALAPAAAASVTAWFLPRCQGWRGAAWWPLLGAGGTPWPWTVREACGPGAGTSSGSWVSGAVARCMASHGTLRAQWQQAELIAGAVVSCLVAPKAGAKDEMRSASCYACAYHVLRVQQPAQHLFRLAGWQVRLVALGSHMQQRSKHHFTGLGRIT